MEVVASLSQGRTAAAQCGLFTHKSVPVIFEPPCIRNLLKCYIWCIVLYGAETWTVWKVDPKYLGSYEVWCWRRLEKISWTDRERNKDVMHSEG